MSSPYTPYNHNAVHAELRDEVRRSVALMLDCPEDADGPVIEAVTDSFLMALATAWTLGFYEGMEECCGMGAFPNPYVKDPT